MADARWVYDWADAWQTSAGHGSRGFETGDTREARPVAVVSRAFARAYWPDASAIGKHVVELFTSGQVDRVELERDLLAELAGCLADDAAQARQQGVERHHAGAHEAFLQFRAHARLLEQQRFVLAGQVVEGQLQTVLVGRGLGQRARQLLQVGEAVELERIERLLAILAFALVAGDDLRFGFHLQATQLVAHAGVGGRHFGDRATERTQLLFQAGAIDRDLAGVVHQAVEQVGADAHLLLRRTHADVVLVARLAVVDRCRQRGQTGHGRAFGCLGHGGGRHRMRRDRFGRRSRRLHQVLSARWAKRKRR